MADVILIIENLTIPILMILVAFVRKNNPKEYIDATIVNKGGFSTPKSRRSKEQWDLAQTIFQ